MKLKQIPDQLEICFFLEQISIGFLLIKAFVSGSSLINFVNTSKTIFDIFINF